MGLFTTRDPDNPRHMQIAIHELGHAWAWHDGGLEVGRIKHEGSSGGACRVFYYPEPDQLRAYAIGCWAGLEAEDKWLRANRLGRAKRGHSAADLRQFRAAVRELGGGLSESKARSLARALVNRRWSHIERTAPVLIRQGRIHL